jgi:hypothetical protein
MRRAPNGRLTFFHQTIKSAIAAKTKRKFLKVLA